MSSKTLLIAPPASGKSTFVNGVIASHLLHVYNEPKDLFIIDVGGSYLHFHNSNVNNKTTQLIDKNSPLDTEIDDVNCIIMDFDGVEQAGQKLLQDKVINFLSEKSSRLIIIEELRQLEHSFLIELSTKVKDVIYLVQDRDDLPEGIAIDQVMSLKQLRD